MLLDMGLAMLGIWILGHLLLGGSIGSAAQLFMYLHLAGCLHVSSVGLCTAYVYGMLKSVDCQFIAIFSGILDVTSNTPKMRTPLQRHDSFFQFHDLVLLIALLVLCCGSCWTIAMCCVPFQLCLKYSGSNLYFGIRLI